MRPRTLCEAIERIGAGEALAPTMVGFVDTFLAAETPAARFEAMAQEPPLIGDARIDTLAGAMAEYLAKHYRLPAVPPWASGPARELADPWFTTTSDHPAMREYLTWASPAEFRSRGIYTAERPFLRARSAA